MSEGVLPDSKGAAGVGFSTSRKSARQAVVVLGEASESDDDEIITDHSSVPVVGGDDMCLAAVSDESPNDASSAELQQKKKVKERNSVKESLLHRKLRETNADLREHIVHACKQPYRLATRDIVEMAQLVVKSQNSVQESCSIVRQVTNDLFHLEDKLDIAIDLGRLVPDIDIRIPAKTPVE